MNVRLDLAGKSLVTCAAVAGIGSAVLAGGACYKDRNIECCMLSSLAPTVCPDDCHNNCEEGGTCCSDIIDPSNVVAHYSQGGPGKVHVTSQVKCDCAYSNMICNTATRVCYFASSVQTQNTPFVPTGASCP